MSRLILSFLLAKNNGNPAQQRAVALTDEFSTEIGLPERVEKTFLMMELNRGIDPSAQV